MTTVFDRFSALLRQDPNTGRLWWKQPNKGRQINKPAGNKNDQGYWIVMIGGSNYRASRIAWLLHYGNWPVNEIDHINRQRDDDRIENLRDVNSSENMLNTNEHKDSVTGIKGISIARSGKYVARKQNKYLGSYNTKQEAMLAYARG